MVMSASAFPTLTTKIWWMAVQVGLTFLSMCTTLVSSQEQQQVQEVCTLCRNGEPITLLDKAISLPAPLASITTCGQLDGVAAIVPPGDDCRGLQSIGTFCG